MAGYRTGKLDLLESHSKTLMNEAEKYHSYMVETIRVIDTMAGYVNDYSTELRLRQLEERIYQTIQNIPQRLINTNRFITKQTRTKMRKSTSQTRTRSIKIFCFV